MLWAKARVGSIPTSGTRIELDGFLEAEKAFNNNPDLSAIAIDACVPGDKPNTIDMIRGNSEKLLQVQ